MGSLGRTAEGIRPRAAMKATQDNKVKLRLVGEGGRQVLMRVKRTTQMKKMKRAFTLQTGLHLNYLEFFINGDKIDEDKTPEDLEMEEEDMVEVQNKVPSGWRAIESLESTLYLSPEGKKFNSLQAAHRFLSLPNAESDILEKKQPLDSESPVQEGTTSVKVKKSGIVESLRKTALLKNCSVFKRALYRSAGS